MRISDWSSDVCSSDLVRLRASVALIALVTGAPMAVAQTAPPAEASGADSAASEAQGGDIVVTGIRQSLSRAAEIKRESTAVVDSIVAEDIGRLPDLTTAQRKSVLKEKRVSVNVDPGGGRLIKTNNTK